MKKELSMKSGLLLLTSFLLLLNSCNDNKHQTITTPLNSDFDIYINRFVEEAAKRNIEIDINGLNLVISDTLNFYCGYGFPKTKTVQISNRLECWEQRNESDKEILIFHELGHAILDRQHNDVPLPNNDWKSLMTSENIWSLYTEHTPERRLYYLDELFNPNTPKPNWASTKINPTIKVNDSINFNTDNWKYSKTENSKHSGNISTKYYSSIGSSLKISATEPSEFSSWKYELNPKGLKRGSRLVMEVNIKLENVTNDGAAIAIRGTSDEDMVFIGSTEGVTSINGTSPFVKYMVEVPYYVDVVETIELFLLLRNNATGTVYFDDIKVISYE